jgi:hypothetical protein
LAAVKPFVNEFDETVDDFSIPCGKEALDFRAATYTQTC